MKQKFVCSRENVPLLITELYICLQSDYEQTRLNAHTDTHRQTGLNFLLGDPLLHSLFSGSVLAVSPASTLPLILYFSFLSPVHFASPLSVSSSLLCFCAFMIFS